MFTATPTKNVAFQSIGIVGSKTTNSLIKIYTRIGSYQGYETTSNGWVLCFDQLVQLQKGTPTFVDLACQTFTDTSRSFMVYSKAGMSAQVGSFASSNASLKVDTGIFLKDLFKQVKGAALMAGSLRLVFMDS
jgi:hypothetical protein